MNEEMKQAQMLDENSDGVIAGIAEEITGTLQEAFDTLIKRRDNAYAAAIKALGVEIESLSQEYTAIAEVAQNLEALLPAKAREAQRQADVLLLAGKREEAQAKIAEQREAEAAPATMKARQQAISARLEAIGEEKKAIAKRVFSDWYLDCQKVIRPIERGLFVVILDGLQKSFFDFQTLTDTAGDGVLNTLFKLGHIANLTAPERSAEWVAGQKWYGGRR
jgi:regulator of protease activity HflC (stomatin/prohibitin superfamily)